MQSQHGWLSKLHGGKKPASRFYAYSLRKITKEQRETDGMFQAEKELQRKQPSNYMTTLSLLAVAPMFAAAGYSLVYLLAGGGFGGAILIFIVAKMFGK